MTAPELVGCPRCGNPAGILAEMVRSCPFCRRRLECLGRGDIAPAAPTGDYPTWTPYPFVAEHPELEL
jgi:hypothetical protein